MKPLAETSAAAVAAARWVEGRGIRSALASYGIDFDEVIAWSQPGIQGCLPVADDPVRFEARFAGGIAAAIILGIELARHGEVE